MKILAIDKDALTMTVEPEAEDRAAVGLGEWRTAIDDDAGTITFDEPPVPPTVEEALHRLRGRRADAIVNASTARVVEETKGQNRKTRRNNLRLVRLEVKARRKALEAAEREACLNQAFGFTPTPVEYVDRDELRARYAKVEAGE